MGKTPMTMMAAMVPLPAVAATPSRMVQDRVAQLPAVAAAEAAQDRVAQIPAAVAHQDRAAQPPAGTAAVGAVALPALTLGHCDPFRPTTWRRCFSRFRSPP